MNDPIVIAKELRNAIEQSAEYKEYILYRDLFETNGELIELRKQIVRAKNENRMEDYYQLEKQYNGHVIVVNYQEAKTELVSLLATIKNIID